MGKWEYGTLKSVVHKVIDNRGRSASTVDSGYELLEVNAISESSRTPVYDNVRKYVSKETYDTWFRSGHPEVNDILIPTVGTIGNASILKENRGSIAQNLIALKINGELSDADFVYYYLTSPLGKSLILNLDIGGVQPSVKVPHLLELEIPTPAVPEQKAIAEVLSSLDDKIDLLHRQSKTLEAMAEALFRHHFIDNAQDDWEDGVLGDLIDLKYGKGLKKSDRSGSGYPVVGSSGIVDYHSEYLVKAPGIVIGRKGTLGEVTYLSENFSPIDTTYYVVPKDTDNYVFTYFLLKNCGFSSMNSDSAVPGLNRDMALNLEKLIPPVVLRDNFEKVVEPLFSKLEQNKSQINTLENLRDTLLPKLMSGEVRVSYE